jgi:hypothetical protein
MVIIFMNAFLLLLISKVILSTHIVYEEVSFQWNNKYVNSILIIFYYV